MATAIIKDANVYLNGTNTNGYASEVVLPEIAPTMGDVTALGSIGTTKYFQGFEPMECSIKWSAPNNDVQKACLDISEPVELMIRASRDVYGANDEHTEEPVTYFLTVKNAGFSLGSHKAKENNERESKFSVQRIKMVQNGSDVFELDIPNKIYSVGGVDKLKKYRDNLGL